MRYLAFTLSIIIIPCLSISQRLHVGLIGGVSAYNGDLTQKLLPKKTLNPAFGFSLNYELDNQFIIRGGLMHTRVGAHDRDNIDTTFTRRNLSFESSITELSGIIEYYLLNLNDRKYSPYAFVGLALYRFNPYTHTAAGEKVFLQPLSTEGQGLSGYPDRKIYKLTQMAIPLGGGIKFALNDNLRIGAELGIRKLFTDYLDDVSTNYADPADLLAARGQVAVDLSYRGDELADGDPQYPEKGRQRGGAENKDYYSFGGIHLTYRLAAENTGGKGKKNGLGCPTVY